MRNDLKFLMMMYNTHRKLKHTLTLKMNVDELLERLVNKEEYGRPFVTLFPKSVYVPLSKLRLDVQLQLA